MTLPRLICPLVLGIALLGSALPAEAQIYMWKDSNGNPVLSTNPPTSPGVRFYRVGGSRVMVTRPAAKGYTNQYDALIEQHAAEAGVRADLVRAVIQVESGFNPRARSSKGAMGLMQLMPGTAREMGVQNAFDPAENIRGGTTYLRSLLDRYGNDEELALAAYNAGPTAVDKYGYSVPPYPETQQYVSKVQDIGGNGPADLPPHASPQGATAAPSRPAGTPRVIYKTYVMVDGRLMPRYSDQKPASGAYEIVSVAR